VTDPPTNPVPRAPGHVHAPSAWNVPNALTVLRLVLVPLFVWLLLRDGGNGDGNRLIATAAFVVAIVTDRFDGDIARRWNLVTNFGKIADPIADKALTGAAFIGLSYLGELPWWVTVVVMVREWGVTALRFWVIRQGVMPASRGGKLKTVLQAIALRRSPALDRDGVHGCGRDRDHRHRPRLPGPSHPPPGRRQTAPLINPHAVALRGSRPGTVRLTVGF
jgi:CDP-diacylglycerol--glycerol-3-phosphate 3-phosphatidyltransferase